jgi:hypothetical protein
MTKQAIVSGYRVVFALATIVAMAWQFRHAHNNSDTFTTGNFFSFFTIQSNIIGAVVLLYAALAAPKGATWDLIRTASVLYLTITFFVYGILLSGYQEELQTTLPWVDTVLHRIFPLAILADWFIDPPTTRISFDKARYWLVYPFLYLAYSLIRGPIVDWYPYPFLDPDRAGGYAGIAGYSVAILIGVLLFIGILLWVNDRRTVPVPAAAAR